MREIDDDTCLRAFRYYDTDNSGSLDRDEILALSQSLWYVYAGNGSMPHPWVDALQILLTTL